MSSHRTWWFEPTPLDKDGERMLAVMTVGLLVFLVVAVGVWIWFR